MSDLARSWARHWWLSVVILGGCDPQWVVDNLRPGGSGSGAGGQGGAPGSLPPAGCHCSRRPGRLVSPRFCPPGTDQMAAGVIGSEGGAVSLEGQQSRASGVPIELLASPGALGYPVNKISISELSSPPPAGFVDWSPIYRFSANGAPLTAPVRLRLPFSNMEGEVDRRMTIYRAADPRGPWQRLETQQNAGFIDLYTTELGYFFLGHPDNSEPAHCR